MGFNRDLVGLMGFNGDLTNKHGDLIVIEKDFMGKSSMLMLGKQCHKPDHTYGLMVYSTHKNCDDLGMVYSCFNNINLKLGYCGIVTPYIHHHSSDGEQ